MVTILKLNNRLQHIVLILGIALTFTACGKDICSYCGEEKFCEEYDVLGTKRNICDDCFGNVESSLSGNVIMSYASDLVDRELYYGGTPSESFNGIAGTESALLDTASNNGIYNAGTYDGFASDISDVLPIDTTGSGTLTNTTTPVTEGPATDKDSIVSAAAASLAAYDYYIQPTEEDNQYTIFRGSNDANITLDFSTNGNGTVLVISKLEGSSDDDFANVCINCSMAFLGSDDYENKGYNVYESAKSGGNYFLDNCRFLYIEHSDIEINDGIAPITYEISIQ